VEIMEFVEVVLAMAGLAKLGDGTEDGSVCELVFVNSCSTLLLGAVLLTTTQPDPEQDSPALQQPPPVGPDT
jgi:hypothetical protein